MYLGTMQSAIAESMKFLLNKEQIIKDLELKQASNTQLHKKASYWYVDEESDNDVRLEGGALSEIFGLSINGKPNKLRGKSGQLYVLEEFGSNPYGEDVLKIIRPSVEQGDYTYGLILAYGTGGDESSGFAALEKYVRNPKLMNFHAIKNIFEKNRIEEYDGEEE